MPAFDEKYSHLELNEYVCVCVCAAPGTLHSGNRPFLFQFFFQRVLGSDTSFYFIFIHLFRSHVASGEGEPVQIHSHKEKNETWLKVRRWATVTSSLNQFYLFIFSAPVDHQPHGNRKERNLPVLFSCCCCRRRRRCWASSLTPFFLLKYILDAIFFLPLFGWSVVCVCVRSTHSFLVYILVQCTRILWQRSTTFREDVFIFRKLFFLQHIWLGSVLPETQSSHPSPVTYFAHRIVSRFFLLLHFRFPEHCVREGIGGLTDFAHDDGDGGRHQQR